MHPRGRVSPGPCRRNCVKSSAVLTVLLLLLPAAKAYEFTAASTVPAAYRVWVFVTLISSQSLVKQKLFWLEFWDNNLFLSH